MTYEINLQNKIAVVTGAGSGNGLAICKYLNTAGAEVVGIDKIFSIESKKFLDHKFEIDLNSNDLINVLNDKLAGAQINKVDFLVNNAGITIGEQILEYSLDDWDATFKINVTVPFRLSQFCANSFMEPGARIINITSLASEFGFPDNPAYVSSKGALSLLTKSLANDLAKNGIRANAVAPGYIKTRMTEKSYASDHLRKHRDDRMMIDRWGEPDDVAKVVLFLCSDLSDYITGQNIFVDGGWSAKGI